MKITKQIFVSFTNSNIGSAYISIPFKVSTIHVKAIGYVPENQPAAGNAIYGVISSDLVDNQPLGLFYNDATYPYSPNTDVELTIRTPRFINGNFTFYLQDTSNSIYTPTTGGTDNVVLLLEFNE